MIPQFHLFFYFFGNTPHYHIVSFNLTALTSLQINFDINLGIILTYASCLICRSVSKDGYDFEVVGDISQLKPQEDDTTNSAANGIKYFPTFGVCLLVFFSNKPVILR